MQIRLGQAVVFAQSLPQLAKAFKQWPAIFNGDSTITSAVLDRLLHHAETIVIEGSSYRMKDRTIRFSNR